ncbi:MAG: 33 kDa chaperonin [Pseudomonadota bacterium]|jgi:molecular chaperone Hsp33
MDELHKFLFEGLPVRGMLVRLDDSWRALLQRRRTPDDGGYTLATPVRRLLGEMAAAGVLLQANLKFNGAIVLQVHGDGPVKLAVVETQSDLSFRATATVQGTVVEAPEADLAQLVNLQGQGRCAITLDPRDRQPGQQPYQGIVPLHGDRREKLHRLSEVIEHYMLQSEQLDTRLILAADDERAAGLLIQRLPLAGAANLAGSAAVARDEDQIGLNEDYNRIATLAGSVTPQELLQLPVEQLLHRLFWEETVRVYEPQAPRFACRCSRERVAGMLRGLGPDDVASLLAEQGAAEVGCEFCGALYRFDPVDAAGLFTSPGDAPPASSAVQ